MSSASAHSAARAQLIEPHHWTWYGGTECHATFVNGHLLIAAPARVHLAIERMLTGLGEAAVHTFEPIPHEGPLHLGAVPVERDVSVWFLDNLRHAVAVTLDARRAARPDLAGDVTDEALDACGRSAFGLLDEMRSPEE